MLICFKFFLILNWLENNDHTYKDKNRSCFCAEAVSFIPILKIPSMLITATIRNSGLCRVSTENNVAIKISTDVSHCLKC